MSSIEYAIPNRSPPTMLPSERRLVQQVIDQLVFVRWDELDSPDRIEVLLHLEEEFGEEASRWGLRFYDTLKVAEGRRLAAAGGGSLWDRDPDGGAEAKGVIE